MLPPHIIEWIRERERAAERRREERERPRPTLDLPLPSEPPTRRSEPPRERGVTIVPVWGE